MKLSDQLFTPQQKVKMAVCVPCRDQVQSTFTYCLVQLVQHCNRMGLPINVFMQTGSLISRQRQELASMAIKSGATHILWLDSDMIFPPTVAEALLSHQLDIVACNYSTRSTPLKGVAYTKIGEWESWLRSDETQHLCEVEGVGMGCMLVKSDVFSKIQKPWFEVLWTEEFGDFIGEDFYFCQSSRTAGFKVLIDTVLSRQIKHVGVSEFDLAKATGW